MAWPVTGVTAPTWLRGTITNSFVEITASTICVGLVSINFPAGTTAGTQTLVNITNSAGDVVASDVMITAGSSFREHFGFQECVGVKIKSTTSVSLTYVIGVH